MTAEMAAKRPVVRRTQADRARETRQRLIDAAITCICQSGYARATLVDIAKRAKLTKGAIQHHFTDKRELDLAVTVAGFSQLMDHLGGTRYEGSLEERVSAVIDRMYDAYSSKAVRAAIEIARASRKDRVLAKQLEPYFTAEMLDQQWRAAFPDVVVSEARLLASRRLVRTAIQGQIAREAIGVPDDAPLDIDFLKATLVMLLTVDEHSSGGR